MPIKLLKGIRHFKNNGFLEKRDLFQSLIKGQSPDTLLITCSDSRIVPSYVTHADAGELFVIRNAGNIFPPKVPYPTGERATAEYALKVLNVSEIIVCGHSDCGAMKGLLNPNLSESLPLVAEFLEAYAKPALDRVHEKHPEMEDAKQKLKCLTEENIHLQIEHLHTLDVVKERVQVNKLKIHAWYYDIEEGEFFIYEPSTQCFLPYEQAVEKLFNSELVLNRMHAIIAEEAHTFALPSTEEEYRKVAEQMKLLKFKGENIIWDAIQAKVIERLWHEFGELCVESEGKQDSRFVSLLEKCPEIALGLAERCQKNILNSLGYNKACINKVHTPVHNAPSNDKELTPTGGYNYA
ncbi:carbonic anhydrase [Legionella lytica]|uniref:carbonic anhydrase n=1 Tax=Legionella lytica TaxID=96232 RepID=A0ABW8DC73_9GAMM